MLFITFWAITFDRERDFVLLSLSSLTPNPCYVHDTFNMILMEYIYTSLNVHVRLLRIPPHTQQWTRGASNAVKNYGNYLELHSPEPSLVLL